MGETEAPDPAATPPGFNDLDQVQRQIDSARIELEDLLREVAATEARLNASIVVQLLEANEALVVSALRNQVQADTAAQALAEVARHAEFDVLTQLPNRVLLLDRFAQAIANAKRHGSPLALLFLDLDKFKEINDTLGHAIGDEVLKEVAIRLAGTVRENDTVSRHGGDEFLILLTEVARPADAALIARKLLAVLGAPATFGRHELRFSASIGISIFPEDGEDAGVLIDRADAAMYSVKRRGQGGFAFQGEHSPLHPGAAPSSSEPQHGAWSRHEVPLTGIDRRHVELREANERLVVAVFSAQQERDAALGKLAAFAKSPAPCSHEPAVNDRAPRGARRASSSGS